MKRLRVRTRKRWIDGPYCVVRFTWHWIRYVYTRYSGEFILEINYVLDNIYSKSLCLTALRASIINWSIRKPGNFWVCNFLAIRKGSLVMLHLESFLQICPKWVVFYPAVSKAYVRMRSWNYLLTSLVKVSSTRCSCRLLVASNVRITSNSVQVDAYSYGRIP